MTEAQQLLALLAIAGWVGFGVQTIIGHYWWQQARRTEVSLEQIKNLPDDERPSEIFIHMFSGRIVRAACDGALEFYRAMLQGRKKP